MTGLALTCQGSSLYHPTSLTLLDVIQQPVATNVQQLGCELPGQTTNTSPPTAASAPPSTYHPACAAGTSTTGCQYKILLRTA
eukprot:3793003-Prymnesium_polylepis.1